MSSINKVILIGNLGADPDVRYTGSGKAVAELRLATSFVSGDNETTEWHRIILWEKLADVAAKYLKKGSKIYVQGRLQTRTYDDKDGVKRYVTEIIGNELQMLSPKADGAQEAAEPAKPAARTRKVTRKAAADEVVDEDIFA